MSRYMSDIFTGRGSHTLLDYQQCFISHKNTEAVLQNLKIRFKWICQKNNLRIVGENFVLFNGTLSPPGATFALLLDESHITLHSYSLEGYIAVDVFTCCKTPINHINASCDIKRVMREIFPDGILTKQETVPRFLTPTAVGEQDYEQARDEIEGAHPD